jgi:plasmid rolling circle replication initiator protein Rep
MKIKTTKYSAKKNHVADYLFNLSNSNKISLNIRRAKASFFVPVTVGNQFDINGKLQPIVSKKRVCKTKPTDKQVSQTSLRAFNTSGTTAPNFPTTHVKKGKTKEKKFVRPSEKNDPIDIRLSKKSLDKRAQAKFRTQALIRPMVEYAMKHNSPLLQQYRNIMSCNSMLIQKNDTITGSYCGNRACQVCSRIRTAKMIDAYEMPLNEFGENSGGLEFVTLTVKNMKGNLFASTVKKMIKEFTLINRYMREKLNLVTGGIRQLESTYNKITNEYHPHFHIVCAVGHGDIILEQWLKRFPDSNVKGQKVTAWDGNLKELFKYATKIVDSTQKKKKEIAKNEFTTDYEIDAITGKKVIRVNMKALDTILQGFKGVRVTQPFGELAKIKVDEDINKDIQAQAYKDLPEITQTNLVVSEQGELVEEKVWRYWTWKKNDWFCDGLESLSSYKSSQTFIYKFYDY